MSQSPYEELLTRLREIALLSSAGSVLSWDEQTYMPAGAAELRAGQSSLLARLCHEQFTSPRIGELLKEAESDGGGAGGADREVTLRETRREYDRATKLPASLVEEITKVCVLGQSAWVDARKKSDYPQFQPWLDKILKLKRDEANCIGYTGHMYNALLDEYEPHELVEDLNRLFEALRDPLIDLVGRVTSSGKVAPLEILQRRYPAAQQAALAREAAERIGFNFDTGRLDTSVHPFCSDIGPGDTRMTTRYDEEYFADAFFGVLHESGHGLYDQGLNADQFGLPLGEAVSLGIHESQSRMWENLVGRSRAFWSYFFPKAKAAFPEALNGVSEKDWYFAINDVRPSLIRTESDECTYNLHILLRFELEQALISDDLNTTDLPAAWNERMQKYLGIKPPSDAEGCLQDIHWSGGSVGYFPTYTLGNLYAAQFFESAKQVMPDLEAQFAQGEFSGLLDWLRKNIHSQGKRYPARKLVKQVTGSELSAEPLLRHLRAKTSEIYGI